MSSQTDLAMVWEIFKCVRCSNINYSFHYTCSTCSSGEVICEACKNMYGTCTLNHDTLVRNFFAEKMSQWIPLPCPNKENGCKLFTKGNELAEHAKICTYSGFKCPVEDCESILLKYNFCSHASENHYKWNTYYPSGSKSCSFALTISIEQETFLCYIPAWGHFVYRIFYNAGTHTTYHSVHLVDTHQQASKYKYMLALKSTNSNMSFCGQVEPIAFKPEVVAKRGNCMLTSGSLVKDNSTTTVMVTILTQEDASTGRSKVVSFLRRLLGK